jgi:hypothetical protein
MKVKLPDGRVARITVLFGTEVPPLKKPLPPRAVGKDFRSVRLTLNIYENEAMQDPPLFAATGISYCNPLDQFQKFEGRKRAMFRLMRSVGWPLRFDRLSKNDLRILCPIMLRGPLGVAK